VSDRYIELFEQITGRTFVKDDTENLMDRVQRNVESYLA
ncbi:MAG: phosphoribosylaminoimidazole-succinocarboxamide synthase, partial [Sphingobacteriales bacterium]